jgi:DNA/RNA endonuclease YhcR with UshA esterase domain
MRKIFSLIAAVLFAGSMFAAEVTVSKSIHDLFPDDANGTKEATLYSDAFITISVNNDGNNGKVYGDGTEWRLYQSNNAVVTVAATNATIKTVAFEFTIKNTAVLNYGENAMTSNEAVNVNAASAQFVVANSGEATNGQVIIKGFTLVYEAGDAPEPVVAPYCQTEVGHFFAENADPNSFVLLSIGAKNGKTIVRIDQDAAKNTQMFDYLQVTGIATTGEDVAEGGATAMAVEFDTPAAVDDSITLEILWSTVNWPGRWMVQNVKVPATAACEYAVLVPAPVVKKTCAEVYTLAKNDAVALNDVVVTFANGKNVWVKDATASMLVFLPATSDAFKAGDVLSEVAGVVDIYSGVYEVKPTADQVTAIVATPGDAPAAEVVAEVALTDVNKYIVMQNVEFAEDAAFAEGTQSNITINGVTVRNQFKNGYSFTAGKKYNIYGVVTIYSSKPQVYFITAEEASGTAIDNTVVSEKAIKMFENGQLIIIKNGVKYNALGSVIE